MLNAQRSALNAQCSMLNAALDHTAPAPAQPCLSHAGKSEGFPRTGRKTRHAVTLIMRRPLQKAVPGTLHWTPPRWTLHGRPGAHAACAEEADAIPPVPWACGLGLGLGLGVPLPMDPRGPHEGAPALGSRSGGPGSRAHRLPAPWRDHAKGGFHRKLGCAARIVLALLRGETLSVLALRCSPWGLLCGEVVLPRKCGHTTRDRLDPADITWPARAILPDSV